MLVAQALSQLMFYLTWSSEVIPPPHICYLQTAAIILMQVLRVSRPDIPV